MVVVVVVVNTLVPERRFDATAKQKHCIFTWFLQWEPHTMFLSFSVSPRKRRSTYQCP